MNFGCERWLRVLALFFLCLPAGSPAAFEPGSSIDAVFADIGNDEPGCAVGVIHEREFAYKAGYGLANMEHGVPIDSRTVFRIGSVSKQFTAMAIALLAERGDLDLDADVHRYLPELIDYGHEVTVRQMVHHVAGMGDYDHEVFVNAFGREFRFGNEDYATIGEFYGMVAQADLVRDPGSVFLYSNLGYFLLAHVVEKVSGKSLRRFAAEEIFAPLGMQDTRFNDNVNELVTNRADGYRRRDDGQWEILMTNLSWVGDGGVYTTIDDFLHWDRNFYDNRLGSGGASLIELVETPLSGVVEETEGELRPVSYAFGLQITDRAGGTSIGHGGSWVAYTAFYDRYPDLELSVVVFCNSLERSAYDYGARVVELAVDALRGGAQD